MKFVYSEWSEPINCTENVCPVVVIENQKEFRTFLCELDAAIYGSQTKCVLSKNNTPIDISKNLEIVTDFINFDINKKPLLNKMISALENEALKGESYLKTQEFILAVEKHISEWSFDFPCDVVSTKLSVSNILKAVGIEVKNDYSGHIGELEKVLDYMSLVREFDRDKLFVFVNMRSFFDDEDIKSFTETVVSHNFKILMIESKSYPVLKNEKRLTIDVDLCEF